MALITRRAEYNAARDAVGRGLLQQLTSVVTAFGVDRACPIPSTSFT